VRNGRKKEGGEKQKRIPLECGGRVASGERGYADMDMAGCAIWRAPTAAGTLTVGRDSTRVPNGVLIHNHKQSISFLS
jgi:hypothetical protein